MVFEQLDFVKHDLKEIVKTTEKPKSAESSSYFFQLTKFTLKLIFAEKEIFFFSLLQILFTVAGYILWLQGIYLLSGDYSFTFALPPVEYLTDASVINSLLIVAIIISIPIGILNACIGAVYTLRMQNKESTIATCFGLVLLHKQRLLFFYALDTWMTVQRFINLFFSPWRLNKESGELLYQAWKLGTIGILPSLLNGRDLVHAGKESVLLVKAKTKQTLLMHLGYQTACSIVSIYASLGFIYWYFSKTVNATTNAFELADITIWLGMPVVISLILIQLFLRPIFILSSAALYKDFLKEKNNVYEHTEIPNTSEIR